MWYVTDAWIAFARIPIILPKTAPTAIDGTKIPAGTLHPYDKMTRPVRMMAASSRELTMRHCVDVLYRRHVSGGRSQDKLICRLLAKAVVISTAFAFLEQNLQTLRHVDSKKTIEVSDHG